MMKWKRLLSVILLLLCASPALLSQTQPKTFTITATAQCATIQASNNSVVGIVTTGTWVGTLTPTLKIYGATTGVAKKVTPVDGAAQATITTGDGSSHAYTAAIGGFTEFDLCSTGTWTSGTATVQLYATPAVNVGALGTSGSGTIAGVTAGTGLNGGGVSGTVTLNLNTALPNGETATTQTAGDSSTKLATDAFTLANSASPNGSIDGSLGYVSGDPCATIAANITTAVAGNPQGIELNLGNFAKIFANGIVPCLSNPFENQVFSGHVFLGPIQIVKSVPWVTPGNNQRVGIYGDGTSDPGVTIASTGSTLTDCDVDAPGWNGTACVIGAVTVPAFPSTGHCITFTYPHGSFGAGTYCPSLWLGGMGAAGVNFGGSFGSVIQDFTIQSGQNGGNFSVYSSGIQEQSYCQNVVARASNNAGFFFDKVQGNGSGPGHNKMVSCTARMSVADTAAQGYPNVANQIGMGYGIWFEGNGIVVYFTGGTCTTYPQGYPTTIAGGAVTAIKMTYAGSCSNVTGLTCHIGTQHGGTGETCAATTSVNTVTGITAGGVGTGYSLGDTQTGAAFEIADATVNGKNTALMQEAVVIDGVFTPNIRSIHTGYDAGYGIHIGYGSGLVTGGVYETNDLENTSNGVYRLGVGIDFNQVLLYTGKGGSVNSIQNDNTTGPTGQACADSQGPNQPTSIYQPCGIPIENSGLLDQNQNPWILQTAVANAVDGITVANAATANPATVSISATGTDANINLNLVAKGSGAVTGVNCANVTGCLTVLSGNNAQTTTYQVLASDFTSYKNITVASGTFTITLVASGAQPAAGQFIKIINYGSGSVTIASSGQNINGAATSLSLPPANTAQQPTSAYIQSDGTNYFATISGANATTLGGKTFAVPNPIGSTTPNTGSFTSLKATGVIAGGNTVRLTADSSGITATTPGTTFLTLGTLTASTNYSFICEVLYSQATAAVLDGFSVQAATNAATRWDAWGSMDTTNPASTTVTASKGSALNVTTTTSTPVVSATPGAITTVYQARLSGSIQVGASVPTVNIAAFTGNASDAVTIKAGSFCTTTP